MIRLLEAVRDHQKKLEVTRGPMSSYTQDQWYSQIQSKGWKRVEVSGMWSKGHELIEGGKNEGLETSLFGYKYLNTPRSWGILESDVI